MRILSFEPPYSDAAQIATPYSEQKPIKIMAIGVTSISNLPLHQRMDPRALMGAFNCPEVSNTAPPCRQRLATDGRSKARAEVRRLRSLQTDHDFDPPHRSAKQQGSKNWSNRLIASCRTEFRYWVITEAAAPTVTERLPIACSRSGKSWSRHNEKIYAASIERHAGRCGTPGATWRTHARWMPRICLLLNGHKEGGAAWGTRTHDPIITNDVLYQLS